MMIRNFLFHRVSNESDPLWPPMQPGHFDRIIKYLTSHFEVVPLEAWLNDPGAFGKKGRKPASVLFDDGYKDNIQYAAPILHKYKCPASFYVVTGCIDNDIPTWTYIVDNAFQKTKMELITLDLDFVPGEFRTLHFSASGKELIRKVKPWMKSLSNEKRLKVLELVTSQCSDVPPPSGKMMSWTEVKQLATDGFIIGSHSHTHPMLASLSSEDEIRNELLISYQKTEAGTGMPPLSISYPIGSYDERVMRIAVETGYKYGLAVRQQFYRTYPNDIYAIPRVELYQESWLKTMSRVSGLYSFVKRIWS